MFERETAQQSSPRVRVSLFLFPTVVFVQRASSFLSHCALITCKGRSFSPLIPRQAHHYARHTPSPPELTQTFCTTAPTPIYKTRRQGYRSCHQKRCLRCWQSSLSAEGRRHGGSGKRHRRRNGGRGGTYLYPCGRDKTSNTTRRAEKEES